MMDWADFYEHCWALLVRHAGARPSDGANFVRHCLDEEHPLTEYRFCGLLGFGGKFWRNDGRVYIRCYPEDETPARLIIIEKTNKALTDILPAGGVHGPPERHARLTERSR